MPAQVWEGDLKLEKEERSYNSDDCPTFLAPFIRQGMKTCQLPSKADDRFFNRNCNLSPDRWSVGSKVDANQR
jgi:hypothetical protein